MKKLGGIRNTFSALGIWTELKADLQLADKPDKICNTTPSVLGIRWEHLVDLQRVTY